MLGVLLRLPGTWDDPAQAWPPSSQPLLPGPVGMYAAAVLTFWLPALAYGLLVRLVSPAGPPPTHGSGAPGGPAGGSCAGCWSWARGGGGSSWAAATASATASSAGCYLAVEQCHSVLAFGPPGSFKTHGLVIPAILEWQGNLVTTSIKPDVLRATCAHRASLGAVWVYDPLGLVRRPGRPVDPAGLLPHLRRRPPDRPDAGRGRRRPGPQGR